MTDKPIWHDAHGFSQVRYNLIHQEGYRPYCANTRCMSRINFDGEQFNCHDGYRTKFPKDFIEEYKKRWSL